MSSNVVDNQQQQFSATPKQTSGKLRLFLKVLLLAALIGASSYGAYFYGTSRTKTNDPVTENKKAVSKEPENAESFHSVLAVGYPFATNKMLTTKLAAPSELQAIYIDSNNQDRGYSLTLANKFNEEMGRWIFGNPLQGDGNKAGDVSLIHIGEDWLKETASETDSDSSNTIFDYDFTTPTKKASSLAKLEQDTAACAKDSAKGFTLSSNIKVCYESSLVRQSVGSYNPNLNLKGYGQIDSQKYVLFGYLNIAGSTKFSEEEADKNGADFVAGNIPSETKAIIQKYVNALKNTTISSTTK